MSGPAATYESVSAALVADTIAVEEAAQQLVGPARSAFEEDGDLEKTESGLWSAWSAIAKAAADIPHDQDAKQGKLVQVVRTIKDMPHVEHPDKELEIWGQVSGWDDLPLMGAVMRENLDSVRDKNPDGFVNFNAFLARVTALDLNDFTLYALWMTRDALEAHAPEDKSWPAKPHEIKAAAVWFTYAAELLFKLSQQQKSLDGKMGKEGASLKGKAWTGFNEERWEIWRVRFHKLQEADIPNDAQNLVTSAIREMTRASQR